MSASLEREASERGIDDGGWGQKEETLCRHVYALRSFSRSRGKQTCK